MNTRECTCDDEVREQVVTALGAQDGILVVDETDFPKKGQDSAGVARQDSGTLGTIGKGQVGVFLASASPDGFAAIDRERYLPQDWLDDPARCRQGGISSGIPMQTKPHFARQMLGQARDAGVPAAWVVADGGLWR